MNMSIQTQGFVITEALRAHIARRMQFDRCPMGNQIRNATIRLSDVNGPKGGNDKRCTIELQLPGKPILYVADTEADLYAAIDRAVERCKRSLARQALRLRQRTSMRTLMVQS